MGYVALRVNMFALAALAVAGSGLAAADAPHVTDIKAVHHDGQTFVTWTDVAQGQAGAKYRYSLYRSDAPITQENLAKAELCCPGILNNSCKQFGRANTEKDRIDPRVPTCIIEDGGKPLPDGSGLAVRTAHRDGKSFYAVMVNDDAFKPVGQIVPGQSATTEAVEEKVAPIQPIRIVQYTQSRPSGKPNLPLEVSLHGSQRDGGTVAEIGDFYLYFGTAEMGWRDGLPGVFAVSENQAGLKLSPRDAIENPRGDGILQSWWSGYYCRPVGAAHEEPRFYEFTTRRLDWMTHWVIDKYRVDPERIYCQGQSMGGGGVAFWAFRRPALFAAVVAKIGRVRARPSIAAAGLDLPGEIILSKFNKPIFMADGKTDFFKVKDSVAWVGEHHEDLPFYSLACGRKDTMIPWRDNTEMARALAAGHHGFAMAWNSGTHSTSTALEAAKRLERYYGAAKFSLSRSYPAFSNSSIDDRLGNGDPADGDPVGGINLGFLWSDVVDEDGQWSVKLENDLCKERMTVDVTPRNCQKFKIKAGQIVQWTNSAGGSGEVAADPWGLVTVEKVVLVPGEKTTLSILRAR
ncbi:MAG: hypothetical protein BIFFINMI_02175 [Phycisphaerae bacterium]|nr:hypothetical protein [Phycisphaerae bacterium]